jgi:import inner membrane translocase subunit TIM21
VGIGAFAAACAYWIIKELVPTKMSPNSVFDRAFHVLRDNPEIQQRFGEPLKAYGRDHGGHREGRRNFVENTQYPCKEDGSNRTRIRFNLEGKFGHAYVFAEVSSDMPAGEFVYLLVQDKRNGRVITIVDNRTALTVRRMAGESKEGNEVLHNLLVGSSSSKK